MTVGEMIRYNRKQAGMTQKDLAAILHVPYQSVGQWERNLRTPKFETVQLIAHALNVSWTDLYPDSYDEGSLLYQGIYGDDFPWHGSLSDDWLRRESAFAHQNQLRGRLLKAYGELGDADREKAVEMIERMAEAQTDSQTDDVSGKEGGD